VTRNLKRNVQFDGSSVSLQLLYVSVSSHVISNVHSVQTE